MYSDMQIMCLDSKAATKLSALCVVLIRLEEFGLSIISRHSY